MSELEYSFNDVTLCSASPTMCCQGSVVGAIEARDGDTEARPARNLRFTLLNGQL